MGKVKSLDSGEENNDCFRSPNSRAARASGGVQVNKALLRVELRPIAQRSAILIKS